MLDTLETILDTGIVAIIRSDSPAGLLETVRALAAGGVRAIEVTMTTPGALEAISAAAAEAGDDFAIGAGSVRSGRDAERALDAGAEFLVMPVAALDAVRVAKQRGKVACPGALSPTEAATAWAAGADVIKIFPASFFGPAYIQALAAPMPEIRTMAVGGVDAGNAAAFLAAGACALGVGSSLIDRKAIAAGDWPALTRLAERFVRTVAEARPAGGGHAAPA